MLLCNEELQSPEGVLTGSLCEVEKHWLVVKALNVRVKKGQLGKGNGSVLSNGPKVCARRSRPGVTIILTVVLIRLPNPRAE